MQGKHKALLPAGFEDLLPPQAEVEQCAIARLMAVFSGFDYARVKPPIAEFEESLLAIGPGAARASDTFRLMDPVTHRTMGVRSDITPQIARIAHSRLSAEARPLRLCYANDVVRTRGSQQRTQRQFMQAGCEMIGVDTPQADIEAVVVALKGLNALGLKGITVDFALPQIFDAVLEAVGGDVSEIDSLRPALAGGADKALVALDALSLSGDALGHLQRLRFVVEGVVQAIDALGLSEVSLTIDPLETQGFEYHSGVAFTLFAEGARGELGRGGRYMIYDDGAPVESAVGFTFYMDTIREVFEFKVPEKRIFVLHDVSWAVVAALQGDGWVVRRGVDGGVEFDGCTHRYNNGKIEEK